MIPLGTIVKDKVTGFIGVAENRATYLFGCDRYCIQARVGEDGKIPESVMIDEPQLEIVEGEKRVMAPIGTPDKRVELGQLVKDPVRDQCGTVIGRAVYLNGCSRVLVEPKQTGINEKESWWVDEKQVEPQNTFLGKKQIVKDPDPPNRYSGGPAPSSSKY
ncbi:hypothetical protein [Desulforhopalus singaporensis]|uniref:Uncharacterized protein n=1 Tax=Desulforhopalus singaporensis TaxID=91360 RepID=A0A1H0W3P9_9BACT|nr:hypothetical protein [Desulforhopalus singaporensis]SDP85125.1 hypothetical protein SAMN05660330_04397 [Desulforhopalus singaporensis]